MEVKETKNLMDGLFEEMNRVRDIKTEYEALPFGAGRFAASLMGIAIAEAESAIKAGDTVKMMGAYTKLKEFEL